MVFGAFFCVKWGSMGSMRFVWVLRGSLGFGEAR